MRFLAFIMDNFEGHEYKKKRMRDDGVSIPDALARRNISWSPCTTFSRISVSSVVSLLRFTTNCSEILLKIAKKIRDLKQKTHQIQNEVYSYIELYIFQDRNEIVRLTALVRLPSHRSPHLKWHSDPHPFDLSPTTSPPYPDLVSQLENTDPHPPVPSFCLHT